MYKVIKIDINILPRNQINNFFGWGIYIENTVSKGYNKKELTAIMRPVSKEEINEKQLTPVKDNDRLFTFKSSTNNKEKYEITDKWDYFYLNPADSLMVYAESDWYEGYEMRKQLEKKLEKMLMNNNSNNANNTNDTNEIAKLFHTFSQKCKIIPCNYFDNWIADNNLTVLYDNLIDMCDEGNEYQITDGFKLTALLGS